MDQLNIFVQHKTYVAKDDDVIIDRRRMIVIVVVVQFFYLYLRMRIDARSYCLLSEKKQSMFCAHASRSCFSLSLYFSSLTTTIHFFLFSAFTRFYYTLSFIVCTHMSRRRQRRRRRDFPPLSLYVKRKTREGKEKEYEGDVDEQCSPLSRLVSLITNSFSWPTHSALDKVPWAKSVSRCVYRSVSRGEKRKSVLLLTMYIFFFLYSRDCISVNDVNRKHK